MCSLTKIVIDWSMTVLKQLSKNVMERSITIFASIRNGLSQKIVIDWSMTIFSKTAHPTMVSAKIVIDRSMTF